MAKYSCSAALVLAAALRLDGIASILLQFVVCCGAAFVFSLCMAAWLKSSGKRSFVCRGDVLVELLDQESTLFLGSAPREMGRKYCATFRARPNHGDAADFAFFDQRCHAPKFAPFVPTFNALCRGRGGTSQIASWSGWIVVES